MDAQVYIPRRGQMVVFWGAVVRRRLAMVAEAVGGSTTI